jgi:pyruvyltransferase
MSSWPEIDVKTGGGSRQERKTLVLKQFTLFPNVGDAASRFIVSRLTGYDIEVVGEEPCAFPNFLAIGSILHWADHRSVIWGTGFISATVGLPALPARILAVRGHLTRTRLSRMNLDSPSLVGDPGALIAEFVRPAPRVTHQLGLVPHYVDARDDFVRRARARGVMIIDPLAPIKDFIQALTSCRRIISSSLHGIIFAHAFDIPAAWVKISPRVIGDGFKFFDYYSSIGFQPQEVPALGPELALDRIVDRCALPRIPIDKAMLRATLMELLASDRMQR